MNNGSDEGTDSKSSGGGKNAQQANQKAKQAAQEKYEIAKKEYETLGRKPNKTPDDKKLLKKLEKQVAHLNKKLIMQAKITVERIKEIDNYEKVYNCCFV